MVDNTNPAESGEEDDELDLALQDIQRRLPGHVVIPVTATSPPSHAKKDHQSRLEYLRTICANYHFRLIVDWLAQQQVWV